jgi:hypothetical protein
MMNPFSLLFLVLFTWVSASMSFSCDVPILFCGLEIILIVKNVSGTEKANCQGPSWGQVTSNTFYEKASDTEDYDFIKRVKKVSLIRISHMWCLVYSQTS